MRRRRRLIRFGAIAAGLLLVFAVTLLITLRSAWFREQVRQKLVGAVETATGGRAEIGAFEFQWTRLRAEVREFTLHGKEDAGRPPLFHASSASVGLKIVSMLKRDIDVQSVEVANPRIYLIVYPDGSTNVPAPKVRRAGGRPALETILNLAVGQFNLRNGVFELERRGRRPFDARGQNLNLRLIYEAAAPRYQGNLKIDPLEMRFGDYSPVPFGVDVAVSLERNRISLNAGKLTTGDSEIGFSGALDDLTNPRASFRYDARVALADLARILRLKGLESGTAQLAGEAQWARGSAFTASGSVRAAGVQYRDNSVRIRGAMEGPFAVRPDRVVVSGARVSGSFGGPGPCRQGVIWGCASSPYQGRIAEISVRGRDLDLDGVAISALGGNFQGAARVRNLDRFTVKGEVAGMEGRRSVALYSRAPLPWDAKASGPVLVEGSFRRRQELRVSALLSISPAPDSAPVHGHVDATYEARGRTLDLGRSTVVLPASRADFTGVIGRELRVHFETRDLADVLPAVGQDPAAFPVRLQGGEAIFNGTVAGNLDAARIQGLLTTGALAAWGRSVDSVRAEVNVAPDGVRFQNATAVRGRIRTQFQGSIRLANWRPGDASLISGSASLRDAPVSEVALVAEAGSVPVTGTLSANAQFSGTVAKPLVTGDIEVAKGALRAEPFDRFTAHVSYGNEVLELSGGQIAAGEKQLRLSATYRHQPKRFNTGSLGFQLTTGSMPLEDIVTLRNQRPDVRGALQVTAGGQLEIAATAQGGTSVRLGELHADATARGLQLTGQTLGDAHLTAQSEGRVLRAHLDADFANSVLRGDGQFRLEGDYPGTATLTFSRLDFAQLRAWVAPETAERISGSAEGQLRLDGPALKPEAIKAELRVPKLEIGVTPGQGIPGSIILRNSGPLAATLANSVVTISNARLVGRSTDITVGGRVNLKQQRPLDLNVNGRVDLGILEDFHPDFKATGALTANARVQGVLDAPLIDGRMQFKDTTFNIVDFPNGVSGASGAVIFTGNRATIQNFTGETGGGRIALSGFASYGAGPAVFRLQARAEQVRVRYPEGVSTVANANLNLTGTTARSTLSGTVTVLRTGFNPQSDFSSIIARSAEPVRTPSARTGFLGGLNFEVQVNTDPDIEVESSLTQDIQVEAHLTLRGNLANPAVVGRVNVTQGQVLFYGTRYTINQGAIAFYNPLKIEPILDIDLETRARGIDVTLSVTGPLNKLNLTPRSDPPLQFSEIVALLATGRAPTSDPTLLAQQSIAPQSWQQMGGSALLGQAIASPVAGRLQRFFGVSKLRIDPTLPGVESNPQARVTLEQQITPDLTFTYITNVTSSNPQVVRMEWAVSKQWSVVAQREENGVFGLDFFFRRRF